MPIYKNLHSVHFTISPYFHKPTFNLPISNVITNLCSKHTIFVFKPNFSKLCSKKSCNISFLATFEKPCEKGNAEDS